MTQIIVSLFSKQLRNGKVNPKNYPWSKQLVSALQKENCHVIQVGTYGEENLGAQETKFNTSLADLKNLLNASDTWISVDTFLNHFASFYKKKGVVLFGQSDPNIFGYEQNINLLKSKKYLRERQFDFWENCEYSEEAFVLPEVVVEAVKHIITPGNPLCDIITRYTSAKLSTNYLQYAYGQRP